MVKRTLFIALLALNLFAANTDEVSVFDMMDEAREDKFVNSPSSKPQTKTPSEEDISRKLVSPRSIAPQPERITPEQMRISCRQTNQTSASLIIKSMTR